MHQPSELHKEKMIHFSSFLIDAGKVNFIHEFHLWRGSGVVISTVNL